MLSACVRAAETELSVSIWGRISTVGQAEQVQAPAIATTSRYVMFAWMVLDGQKSQVVLRSLHHDGEFTEVVSPYLVTALPHEVSLYPSTNQGTHLLWLDVDATGITQLYHARVNLDLSLFRGAVKLSHGGARCYDVLIDTNGSLKVVWQNGHPLHPQLHSAKIDPTGLGFLVSEYVASSGCPKLVKTVDQDVVMWQNAQNMLVVAPLLGDYIGDGETKVQAPILDAYDRFHDLQVGSEGNRIYGFWNITRADGKQETWMSHGQITDNQWSKPQPLTVYLDATEFFETTLNTGRTLAASQSATLGQSLAWVSPLDALTHILPVAGVYDGYLSLVYFKDGSIVGYQAVTAVDRVLSVPEIRVDQDRHVYLTWSEPTVVGYALMQVTSTKSWN